MDTALLQRDSTPGDGQSPASIVAASDAELLAQMIHDIKNPLSAILCYTEIVAEAKEDERREYCDRLHANARAVLDLLDGFGLLVALRGLDTDQAPESFDWVRQAMRIATDLHAVAAFRSQRIACDSVGERFLRGDRAKLSVAIRGLLLEGLRVCAPNETVDVHIRATATAAVEVVVPSESASMAASLFDVRRPALELVARVADLHHGSFAVRTEASRAVATLSVPFE